MLLGFALEEQFWRKSVVEREPVLFVHHRELRNAGDQRICGIRNPHDKRMDRWMPAKRSAKQTLHAILLVARDTGMPAKQCPAFGNPFADRVFSGRIVPGFSLRTCDMPVHVSRLFAENEEICISQDRRIKAFWMSPNSQVGSILAKDFA